MKQHKVVIGLVLLLLSCGGSEGKFELPNRVDGGAGGATPGETTQGGVDTATEGGDTGGETTSRQTITSSRTSWTTSHTASTSSNGHVLGTGGGSVVGRGGAHQIRDGGSSGGAGGAGGAGGTEQGGGAGQGGFGGGGHGGNNAGGNNAGGASGQGGGIHADAGPSGKDGGNGSHVDGGDDGGAAADGGLSCRDKQCPPESPNCAISKGIPICFMLDTASLKCGSNDDCESKVCLSGRCSTGNCLNVVCPQAKPNCWDTLCFNASSDSSNCGKWGNVCPDFLACRDGVCQDSSH